MDPAFRLSIETTFSEEDGAVVDRGLMDHARGRGIQPDNQERFAVFLRDASGAVVGGLVGALLWEWLYIRLLWVADPLRGRGYGAKILRAAEDEAARRGCHHARLETFDPDALRFYQREGYETFGVLPDCPKGHTRYCLAKPIKSPSDPAPDR
jgi:GNAT superfamily N-acetyltransferase